MEYIIGAAAGVVLAWVAYEAIDQWNYMTKQELDYTEEYDDSDYDSLPWQEGRR